MQRRLRMRRRRCWRVVLDSSRCSSHVRFSAASCCRCSSPSLGGSDRSLRKIRLRRKALTAADKPSCLRLSARRRRAERRSGTNSVTTAGAGAAGDGLRKCLRWGCRATKHHGQCQAPLGTSLSPAHPRCMAHVHCGSSHNSNSPPAPQARHTSSYASLGESAISCSCPAVMERCSSRVSRSRAARSVAWKSAPVRQLSGCSVRHIGHLPASFAAFQVLPMQSRWNVCVHDSETVGRGVPCNGSRQTAHVADDALWLDAAARFSPAIELAPARSRSYCCTSSAVQPPVQSCTFDARASARQLSALRALASSAASIVVWRAVDCRYAIVPLLPFIIRTVAIRYFYLVLFMEALYSSVLLPY
eukprot:COSAG02_NODE_692_length_18432_cov_12.452681_6_plen_360_part_00